MRIRRSLGTPCCPCVWVENPQLTFTFAAPPFGLFDRSAHTQISVCPCSLGLVPCACLLVHLHPDTRLCVSDWVCVLSCVLTFSSRSRSPHQDPEASLCLPAKNDCISWTPWRQGTAKCHLEPLQSDERKTGRGEWRKMEMGG